LYNKVLHSRIFSVSFLMMFLFPEIATSVTTHVPFSLSRIMMSGTLIGMFVSVIIMIIIGRNQWPCGLRRRPAAAPLLGLRVRIPQGHGYLSLATVGCCQVDGSASG
jgi:hypothetical protein